MNNYHTVKNSLFFKMYHHPIIEGKNNIPKSDAVIFCGNHLSDIDAQLVTCSAGRIVSWKDLREHSSTRRHRVSESVIEFVSNGGSVGMFPEEIINIYRLSQLKVMFLEQRALEVSNSHIRSGDKMTSLSYLQKAIDTELKVMEEAKKELINKGINVVDYDVLLPFSKDAIALASETGAAIVPFAVCGKYSYRTGFRVNRIRFGEAFKVYDEDESSRYLEESVKKLIYK